MERRQKILDGIDIRKSAGLEVGALCSPLVKKSEGEIYYVDRADTASLKSHYADDESVTTDAIVDVDFVWGLQSLKEATRGQLFDYIVASRVIEHVPDLLTWLQELQSVLKSTGSIRLAISDRRFSFDCLRQNTQLAGVLDAWLRRAPRPLPFAILDSMMNSVHPDCYAARRAAPAAGPLQRHHTFEHAVGCAQDALQNDAYHDVHCWTFTPSSFAALLEELNRHGLLALDCERLCPTEVDQLEFFVFLRHARDRQAIVKGWKHAREIADLVPASVQEATPSTATRATSTAVEQIAALQLQVQSLTQTVAAFQTSTSWRVTRPLRTTVIFYRQLIRVAKATRASARFRGGLLPMLSAALSTIRREGWAGQLMRIRRHAGEGPGTPGEADQQTLYNRWISRQDFLDARTIQDEATNWTTRPLISIVMPTYNTPRPLLEKAIASVRAQTYPEWELCIADDCSSRPEVHQVLKEASDLDSRIRVVYREVNGHISEASNSALAMATGDFVALLDHDDELHPTALYWVAREINEYPEVALIYSDEDKLDEGGRRIDPYFKCDFNYELLLSHNMISHLGVYRRDVLTEAGGFRVGFEGSQDYDVALRVLERIQPSQIRHIPKVLYHWRAHHESTASGGEAKPYAFLAGQRAIAEHLKRVGLAGEVVEAPEAPNMYRVRLAFPQPEPSVEIIIPTRDRPELMRMSVGSVLEKTSYANYRICIVDNGSVEEETLSLFRDWIEDPRVRVIRDERPFNFSALNNLAVNSSESAFVCLLNNDVEVLSADWLAEMMSHAQRPGIGCVGARLWYPNDTLQHGGVVLGLLGIAGHAHKHLPRGSPGYFGRAVLQQACSAVTAACLLVQRDIYVKVGGLDERLEVAFNDVDFCLRVREAGYRNVWTPHAELYHHESLSRGYEDNTEKQERFLREIEFMRQRWSEKLFSDPFYSPNLTLTAEDFSLTQV